MIVSIHQPSYFPWLGLLDKITKSELYILMDDVQLTDRAYQHRNILLDCNGDTKFITIPINKKGYRDKKIKDITISNLTWQKQHKKFIQFNYKKSPYYDEIFSNIKVILEKNYTFLLDVLIDSMLITFDVFSIKTNLVFQSSLNYDKTKKKGNLILELLKTVNASCYISGTGAQNYLDEEEFVREGILLKFNQFVHPVYKQLNSKLFVEGMSSLDLLFSIGILNSRNIFLKNIK